MRHAIARALALILCLAWVNNARAQEAKQVELDIGGKVALADLVVPEGKALSDGVVLLTHGTLAHKDMELIEALQVALAERGIATLAHTLTLGQDRRKGMYGCAVPHVHAHEDGVAEIAAWVEWLKQEGATRISAMGHSRGGNQVAWAASEQDGFEKVVLLAPALSLSGGTALRILKQRFNADMKPLLKKALALVKQGKGGTMLDVPGFVYCEGGKASARAIASYYGEDKRRNALVNLKKIEAPVLVIAGSKDTAVPDVPARIKPVADGKRIRFAMIDGAGHMFLDFFAEDAADMIAKFVNE